MDCLSSPSTSAGSPFVIGLPDIAPQDLSLLSSQSASAALKRPRRSREPPNNKNSLPISPRQPPFSQRHPGKKSPSNTSSAKQKKSKPLPKIKLRLPESFSSPLVCPICNLQVPGEPEDLAIHVDMCLSDPQEPAESAEPEIPFSSYEINGIERIRPVALMDFNPSFRDSNSIQNDIEGDVNVEEDEAAAFGPSQYSEKDLKKFKGKLATIETSYSSEPTPSASNQPVHMADGIADPTSDPPILIQALKAKIRQQEALIEKSCKCLICMDPYLVPLTSISCWHVHCEECWLKTLSIKKLCPQCNVITSPSDLRRIYL